MRKFLTKLVFRMEIQFMEQIPQERLGLVRRRCGCGHELRIRK